jgi:uncharacterized membrane-anchored protein YitT (DUF2179 family)
MKIPFKRPLWADVILMILGTGLMALAIQCIYDPAGMVVGGFTGIAIVVKQLTAERISGGVPLWLTNLILNIPVFLMALKIKGKRFVGRTAVATVLLSFWLYVLPMWNLTQGDYMLSAIYGGAISGAGIGLVLLGKATTGGTDMVASLIQHYLRHYSVVQIMMILDGIIILFGVAAFGIQSALYAVVAIFITSKLSDALMEGLKYSKAVFIISNKADEVAKTLMRELSRGVTGIHASGMYSGERKNMLYCVVSKKEIVELKDIVIRLDREAFVIVTDAREVLGEGFLEY